jgi:glyoxylase-like metal-dependent hydrolase (beta-lactamase superfamily II)
MEVTKQVHLLDAATGSHVYLVLGAEPVLIDTGFPGRSQGIVANLAALGLKPNDIAHILLTHHDVDHVGNAKALQQLSGANLWAPQIDVPYIHGELNRPGIKRIVQTLIRVDKPHVDKIYAEGQKIGSIEVIPTPGHTPGHVSLLYGDILFAGDLVRSNKGKLNAFPAMMTWNTSEYKKSLKHAGTLSFEIVCPAHGLPVKGANLRDALTNM